MPCPNNKLPFVIAFAPHFSRTSLFLHEHWIGLLPGAAIRSACGSIMVQNSCRRPSGAWAQRHHVLIQFIQPGKPAQNAYIERFNRTYREDILDLYLFHSLQEVRQLTQEWLSRYNQDRPHEALGGLSPIAFALRVG